MRYVCIKTFSIWNLFCNTHFSNAKSLGTFMAFCTLMIWVFRGLSANIVELQTFYISFKSFTLCSASASTCSLMVPNFP